MSNHSRRPVSATYHGGEMPVGTKAVLEQFLGYAGWRLIGVRSNIGYWNDMTTFSAIAGDDDRIVLDVVMKGERRDWQGMWDAFKYWRDKV